MEGKIITLPATSLEERKEIIQDVVDRLLSNPDYKAELLKLNNKMQPQRNYNRYLESYRAPSPTV